MDLFGEGKDFGDLLLELETIAESLTKENELPPRGVIVTKTIGKGKDNAGEVISYSLVISEPEYPATELEMQDDQRRKSNIITIQAPKTKKWEDHADIMIPDYILTKIDSPSDMMVIPQNQADIDAGKVRVRFPIASSNFCTWVHQVGQWRVDNYLSSAPSFGCCSYFEKCSDARKCVHKNRLYATACAYRRHLEAGEIFYGKNKTI